MTRKGPEKIGLVALSVLFKGFELHPAQRADALGRGAGPLGQICLLQ